MNIKIKKNQAKKFFQLKEFDKALEIYLDILSENSDDEEIQYIISVIEKELNDDYDAINVLSNALKICPLSKFLNHSLCNRFYNIGLFDEALLHCKKSLEIDPDCPFVLNSIGRIYLDQGEYDKAHELLEKCLKLSPDYLKGLDNMGLLLLKNGHFKKAMQFYEKAVNLYPDCAEIYNNMGIIFHKQANISKAVSYYKKALEIKPSFKDTHSNYLRSLNYLDDLTLEFIYNEHLKWAEQHTANINKYCEYLNEVNPDKKIRLAYISPDFKKHSVAFFIQALFKYHDLNSFEIICYSNTDSPDSMTQYLKSFNFIWKNIWSIDDKLVAKQIYEDQVDILVDLAGHTDKNSLLVLAYKPAPIQVTWLGYPNTTGLKTIDYKISDEHADPFENSCYYTEKIIRLIGGFLCYTPPEGAPEVSALPASKNGYITFGCFNDMPKINYNLVKIWSNILAQIPKSRLIIKNISLNDEFTKNTYYKLFNDYGIKSKRINLLPAVENILEHLSFYNKIDIALDTFPYNGTTTTCEALWMGVPVIAYRGKTHASRVGASILNHIELYDFIADSINDYIDKAIIVSENIDFLIRLRKNLRKIMKKSNLLHEKKFTGSLEIIFRNMWKKWCTDQQNL